MSSPALSAATIASQKSQMRAEILRSRAVLASATRNSETFSCHQALLALPAYQSAQTILCTVSFGSEIDTRGVIDTALSQGKRVVLSRVNKDTQQLQLFYFDHQTVMEKNRQGIDEPHSDSTPAALADIPLILLPGLAFDQSGNRLGYGRGYFDKLLINSAAKHVAIAFTSQLVEQVPTMPHDAKLNILITATQTQHF